MKKFLLISLWCILLLVTWLWILIKTTPVKTDVSVSIEGFPEWAIANKIATRWYQIWWMDMVTTMIWENGWFDVKRVSPTNDYWLCQLHYTRHKQFINSSGFNSWENQVDYCAWVWQDAIKKWRLPQTFCAYNHRTIYKTRVTVNNKPYKKILWVKIFKRLWILN